jgi:hypothetical protein
VLAVMSAVAAVTIICALFFPNRREELEPELWAKSLPPRGVPAAAE